MNCPKCASELIRKYYKGAIEVDACPNCQGLWLEAAELDKLEDRVFDDDIQKGSLIHLQKTTDFPCPHCAMPMTEFQYRLYDIKLDFCAVNGHGFWLDAGEEERVTASMRQRARDINRKLDAEMEWKQILKNMHSFLNKKFGK